MYEHTLHSMEVEVAVAVARLAAAELPSGRSHGGRELPACKWSHWLQAIVKADRMRIYKPIWTGRRGAYWSGTHWAVEVAKLACVCSTFSTIHRVIFYGSLLYNHFVCIGMVFPFFLCVTVRQFFILFFTDCRIHLKKISSALVGWQFPL